MAVYPMIDNVTQVNVVNTGSSELPTVLAGQATALAALTKMSQTLNALPASQRGSQYAG
jgi:hypothetical protein